jgi:hypothetical protein
LVLALVLALVPIILSRIGPVLLDVLDQLGHVMHHVIVELRAANIFGIVPLDDEFGSLTHHMGGDT